MYTKEAAMFMYKYKCNMLPCSFDGYFTTNYEIHRYNTRNKGDFNIPKRKSKFDSVFISGPKISNGLPNNLKKAKSLSQFKTTFKYHLLTSYDDV